MADASCSSCGGTLIPVDNNKFNSHFMSKVDTFHCSYCKKMTESARK